MEQKTASIEIYTTAHCPHCKVMKKWMNDHDIPYVERDTSIDDVAMAELMAEDIATVPTIKYNGEFKRDLSDLGEFKAFVSNL